VQVSLVPLLVLAAMTVTALAVFAVAQSACLLRSDLAALAASLVVTGVLGAGIVGLGWPTAPLPLFALLLAVHTMMPISKTVSLSMAAILTIAHLAVAVSLRHESTAFYTQVSSVLSSHKQEL
jgi:adenylate cyclase 2